MLAGGMELFHQFRIPLLEAGSPLLSREGGDLGKDGADQVSNLSCPGPELGMNPYNFGDHRSFMGEITVLHRILECILVENIVEFVARISAPS